MDISHYGDFDAMNKNSDFPRRNSSTNQVLNSDLGGRSRTSSCWGRQVIRGKQINNSAIDKFSATTKLSIPTLMEDKACSFGSVYSFLFAEL